MNSLSITSFGAPAAGGNVSALRASASPMGAALLSVSTASRGNNSGNSSGNSSSNAANPRAPRRFNDNPQRQQTLQPPHPPQLRQPRRERDTQAGGLPYPYSAGRDGGLPPSRQLIKVLTQAHTQCRKQPGDAACPAPRATAPSPRKTFLLRRFEDFSMEYGESAAKPDAPAASTVLTFNQLYALLHVRATAPEDAFVAGAMPNSPELRALLRLLSPDGTGRAAGGGGIDQAFARERLGELALAKFALNDAANEAIFTDFNFLTLARLNMPARDIKEVFAAELMQHAGNGALEPETAAWATALILSRLHPALARRDIPADVIFGDLSYAKMDFAIELLRANRLDHGDYPYAHLIGLADTALAGAKLNRKFAESLWQVLIPAALRFAHAGGAIDLRTHTLRDKDIALHVLELFDTAQTKAWRAVWSPQEKAIAALQKELPTRDMVARKQLAELGLNPEDTHQMPYFSSLRRRGHCSDEMSYLSAQLTGCPEIIWNKIGRRVPLLQDLFQAARKAITDEQRHALAGILTNALDESDTLTREDFEAPFFEILLPTVEKKSLSGDDETADTRRIYADLGVIVTIMRGHQMEHYAISPNLNNFIQRLSIETENGVDQGLHEHILKTPANYFSTKNLLCHQPCTSVEYLHAASDSVPDYKNAHKVEKSPGDIEYVPDFYNTKMSLNDRIKTIAWQIDTGLYQVQYAVRLTASIGLQFTMCFAAQDAAKLDESLRACGLALSAGELARLQIRPDALYHAQFRKDMFAADLDAATAERAATRFVESLPQAPAHREGAPPDTLRDIVRQSSQRASDASDAPVSDTNPHRLPTVARLPTEFAETLRKMLASNASLNRMSSALGKAILHGASIDASLAMAPTFPCTSTLDASGRTNQRFHLTGLTQASRIHVPELESQGIFTFQFNGPYGPVYQTDLMDAYPTLRSVHLIQSEKDNAELCREERGVLRKGKKKLCPLTQTVQPDNDGVEWQALTHEAAAPESFIQAAAIAEGLVQNPRRQVTLFQSRNEGRFAERPGLVIVDGRLMERNPNSRPNPAGPAANLPLRNRYEELAELSASGQGIPAIAPLPHSMPAQVIFNGRDQRPMMQYQLRSVDADDALVGESLLGSRIITEVRRDFYSRQLREHPRQALLEVAEGHFYLCDLPPMQDTGSAPVNLVRIEDAAVIEAFTSQETVMDWMLTRDFSVNVARDANFYIEVLRNSQAYDLARNALREEAERQHRFGADTATVTAELSQCLAQVQAGPAEPPADQVGQAISAALSTVLRSPEMTTQMRDYVIDANSLLGPEQNMHFEQIYIAPTVPEREGVLEFLDHRLRRSLDLFADIYEGLNFNPVFDASAMREASPPPGTANPRAWWIHQEFTRVLSARNAAIAVVTLRNGRQIIYHAISGTRLKPALTPEAMRNPQKYVLVNAGEDTLEPPLPCITNLTKLRLPQNRREDTEQLLAARILRAHPPKPVAADETEAKTEEEIKAEDGNQVAEVEMFSRLEFCQSCTFAMIEFASRLPNAKMTLSSFPAAVKSPSASTSAVSPRLIRPTAAPTTRMPAHA